MFFVEWNQFFSLTKKKKIINITLDELYPLNINISLMYVTPSLLETLFNIYQNIKNVEF